MSDPLNPDYYKFGDATEMIDISRHLTSNGGQAVQYIARATRLDGENKGEPIESLRKAIWFALDEIERLGGDAPKLEPLVPQFCLVASAGDLPHLTLPIGASVESLNGVSAPAGTIAWFKDCDGDSWYVWPDGELYGADVFSDGFSPDRRIAGTFDEQGMDECAPFVLTKILPQEKVGADA